MKAINSKIIRQLFIVFLIFSIAALILKELLPYLTGFLGAITLYVLMQKWMKRMVNKGWNADLSAILLLFGSFVGILFPLIGVIMMLSNKIGRVTQNFEKISNVLISKLQIIENKLGVDLGSQVDTEAISGWVSESLTSFAGGTFELVISIGIMYFLLYYMLTNRRKLRESIFEYIPINSKNLTIIGNESRKIVRSNALGIPLVAIIQGIVALVGFLIFKIEDPLFWFVIVVVGSMIPFIGTILGILPVFVLSLSSGDSFQAWGILIYGLVVVGSSDNLVRLFVLKKIDDVHPIITLVGVIIGVPLFGFVGLIFGPLLLSLFLIIVQIYKSEYGPSENE